MKTYSESCDQNKQPILQVLKQELVQAREVLEIGSGTGQHAVFFAQQFPHISWQTSDRVEYHTSIQAWINEAGLDNVLPPIELDVSLNHWPDKTFDAVFSANTTHIMSLPEAHDMFRGVGTLLLPEGKFCLYGPFNYHGQYTSQSNANFDIWLKQRDPNSGIKDFEQVNQWAQEYGLMLSNDYEMPANNRTLVWTKHSIG